MEAVRYTPDELIFLRDSPLVEKPLNLPPADHWMGSPTDTNRHITKNLERTKSNDSNVLLDQSNRRPGPERHMSRNSAGKEIDLRGDIVLAPPKMSFMSSSSFRSTTRPFDSSDRPKLTESESRDRFSFRGKSGEVDGQEGRNTGLRPRRLEAGEDSDGWSTVKPRKSFGADGAERFNGRMGYDRQKDGRFKDREERDTKERQDKPERPRGFETYTRDRDADHDQDREKKNGAGRGRNDSSWFRNKDEEPAHIKDRTSNGDRFTSRARGWREKENEETDRERPGDRRSRPWERDERQEREPEWLDEPVEDKNAVHTQEEFQRWKEQMQGKDRAASGKTPAEETSAKPESGEGSFFGLEERKVAIETPFPIDTGPDKFFGMWAAPKDDTRPESAKGDKPKPTGKASRFTSFFAAPQEELPRQAEPPPSMPAAPSSGLSALFQSPSGSQSNAEKEAFQQLLQKLQRQTISAPPGNTQSQHKPPPERPPIQMTPSYGLERPEEGRQSARNSQPTLQDLLSQRQAAGSQPAARPEQMLQELVGQRQNATSQSSVRGDQGQNRPNNTEFLMTLMQSAKSIEPQRSEHVMLGLPPTKHIDRRLEHQQRIDREQELQREAALQRERAQRQQQQQQQQQQRPQPPPGFFDDPAFHRGPPPPRDMQGRNPQQPTQILQRQVPPGLDQMQPGWPQPPGPLPMPQQQQQQQQQQLRHIAPPPGLAGGPGRVMPPMPPQQPQPMFPPGFPMVGNFPPPPEAMLGPGPHRNMQPPPGFFNGPPPPGFIPPGMGFQGQGPEGVQFGGPPFDGRGPPPAQQFRRQ